MSLLPLEQALALILKDAAASQFEEVGLLQAGGRIVASDVIARFQQPPFDCSAMDGYALIAPSTLSYPLHFDIIGESAAGNRFDGAVGTGQAVRIFTGAPMPAGADTVVIQEDCQRDGNQLTVNGGLTHGRHIRRAGLDFAIGDVLVKTGRQLDAASIALAASGGHARLKVFRQPRVAIIATGDELVPPGTVPGRDQIVASNSVGVAEVVRSAGGQAEDQGIIADNLAAIEAAINQVIDGGADVVITIGGASVGDRDYAFQALENCGVALGFWKIAMRPGKPLMYGQKRVGDRIVHVLGLPGNPVSSLVCARLFLKPLVTRLAGSSASEDIRVVALGADMRANDFRRDFVRAQLQPDEQNQLVATPLLLQDSSMLTALSRADALIIREENAPAAKAGDMIRILVL